MKKLFTFILILAIGSITLGSSAQSLPLNMKKGQVMKEMRMYGEYTLIAEAKDYIEYVTHDSTAIGIRFEKNRSTEVLITMDTEFAKEFIELKESCKCWKPTEEPDLWAYDEIIDDRWVLIKKFSDDITVTFMYYLHNPLQR